MMKYNEWKIINESIAGGMTLGLSRPNVVGGLVGAQFNEDDIEPQEDENLEDEEEDDGDDLDDDDSMDSSEDEDMDQSFPPDDSEEMDPDDGSIDSASDNVEDSDDVDMDFLNDINPELLGDEEGNEDSPMVGSGDIGADMEALLGGMGDEEMPMDDMGDEEMPMDDMGDEEMPMDDMGDEEMPMDDMGDEEMPMDDMGDEDVNGQAKDAHELMSMMASYMGKYMKKEAVSPVSEDALITSKKEDDNQAGQVGYAPVGRIGAIGGGYTMKDFSDLPVLGESRRFPTLQEWIEKRNKRTSK